MGRQSNSGLVSLVNQGRRLKQHFKGSGLKIPQYLHDEIDSTINKSVQATVNPEIGGVLVLGANLPDIGGRKGFQLTGDLFWRAAESANGCKKVNLLAQMSNNTFLPVNDSYKPKIRIFELKLNPNPEDAKTGLPVGIELLMLQSLYPDWINFIPNEMKYFQINMSGCRLGWAPGRAVGFPCVRLVHREKRDYSHNCGYAMELDNYLHNNELDLIPELNPIFREIEL